MEVERERLDVLGKSPRNPNRDPQLSTLSSQISALNSQLSTRSPKTWRGVGVGSTHGGKRVFLRARYSCRGGEHTWRRNARDSTSWARAPATPTETLNSQPSALKSQLSTLNSQHAVLKRGGV